jgi:uracil permease
MEVIMPEQKLPFGKTLAFGAQQMFACFSATVLVPLLVGLPSSVALFSAGVGTVVYLLCTGFKVPMFLGSSFAFIAPLIATTQQFGWGAASGAIICAGLFYAVVSLIISRVGLKWLDVVFPPVVIGSIIMVIGLGLAPTAVKGALYDGAGVYHLEYLAIAIVTMAIIALVGTLAKGFFKAIPILVGLVGGYVFVAIMGAIMPGSNWDLLNMSLVAEAPWLTLPLGPGFGRWEFNFVAIVTFLIVSLATLVEHIGDNYTISGIVGREFYKDPGLHRTILGDGLATAIAGITGSVPNTSYGECSATQAISKVHSVRVILAAAIIAITLSFFGKFSALVGTIPAPVMQGACMILYGMIASSGLRNIVRAGVDYDDTRNLFISSAILTSGIGGAVLTIGSGELAFTLSGMAFATVLGIILNLVLPKSK